MFVDHAKSPPQMQFKVDVCITLKVIETQYKQYNYTNNAIKKLKIHMIKQNMRKQREIVLKII